ncbi:hypothetical protein [Nonomuraea sp. SYSU D8015]|uniref:hypothetical protein n=1 Tax=Nonomuraea sp. SYSU D8015 TaxID=2593644 RepID=UPI001661794A|nr:hypothetical protein [Nonomuraea sp. SYSU D8015]
MKRIRLGKRGWIILSVALAAIIGSAGLAIATPNTDPSDAATCALWGEGPGTARYQQCLDNIAVLRSGSGQVSGSQPGAPTISATNSGTNSQPPMYFCTDPSKSQFASTRPIKGCSEAKTLVCLWSKSDSKYHCVNSQGAAADPPRGICRVNPHFACKDEAIQPTATADPSSPPPYDQPTATTPGPASTPTSLATTPGTPDPTTSLTPTPDSSSPTPATPSASSTATPSPSATTPPTIAADDPVGQALAAARTHNLRIWLDTDLVNAWRAGSQQLTAAASRLAMYATQPGVVGTKMAFDLGLRGGFASAEEIMRFVSETSQVLRNTLPSGRRIAIDIVIPELGCGGNQECVSAMRQTHPLLSLANVERYVLTGHIDAVNVSTGIPTKQYTDRYKIQPSAVTNNLWSALRQRRWENKFPGLFIGAREIGLAHSGSSSTVTTVQAAKLVNELVDIPLRGGDEQGDDTDRLLPVTAKHIVLWTWRQSFAGQTWRLTDSGGQPNAIWEELRKRQNLIALSVAYNPREPETSIQDDIRAISAIASAVFVFVP